MMMLKLGTAMADITPLHAVPLAGYAHRKGNFTGLKRHLHARAWLFIQENDEIEQCKALLIQADLIWWGTEQMDLLKRRIWKRWGIEPASIIFHASHTHGGPQTTNRLIQAMGYQIPDYIDFLEQKVEEIVGEAHANLELVQPFKGTGQCPGISINRRKKVNGEVVMAPNPEGVNDIEVTVFQFLTEAQKSKGVLFHFTCHPTTTSENLVNSDFCGAAMETLDRTLGSGGSCFLQGCCGNIRPALFKEERFYSGNDDDVQKNGEILAETVLEILRQPLSPLKPTVFQSGMSQVELPFEEVPSLSQLQDFIGENELQNAWKQDLLANPDKLRHSETLHLQLLTLAEGLTFLAMDGEVVVEYGLWIKSLSQKQVLPLAYSNGMVGYIPTAEQIREGGYESFGSVFPFGLPSPFSTKIEELIKDGIIRLFAAHGFKSYQ